MRGMRTTFSPLPNDMDALKALLLAQEVRHKQLQADQLAVVNENEQLQRENDRIKAQVLTLQEQLHLAIAINGS